MKKFLIFIGCLIALHTNAQEKINKFYIVDSETKQAVPYVSITIVRAKIAVSTEKDGILIIPGNIGVMRDTVIFSEQSYNVLKVPLHKLNGVDTIKMNKYHIKSIEPNIKLTSNRDKDTLLNKFRNKDIAYYVGLHTETALFEQLQIAQQFDVPDAGIKLKNIRIYRLAFNGMMADGYIQPEPTRFRVRIYDVNPLTGGPGKDICDQVIEEKSNEGERFGINMRKYNIVIPNKTFFVAIEWIRDYFNAGYAMVYNEKTGKEARIANYRPAIGVSPVTGKKLNIWGLNFNHQWKPYPYFMPFGTDLAIRVTIE